MALVGNREEMRYAGGAGRETDSETMNPERGAATPTMEADAVTDETWDDDEPTTEELIEMLKEALHEAETGQTRPAREVMRELRAMLAGHGDAS